MQLQLTPTRTPTSICLRSPGVFSGRVTGARTKGACKQWKCKTCGPRKEWAFIERIKPVPYNWMITFEPGWQPSAENFKRLAGIAREFRRLFCRYIGPIVSWTWVNETGTRGAHVLHKHMVIYAPSVKWMDWRKSTWDLNTNVQHLMDRAGMTGLRRHFERAYDNGVAAYLSKYLGKELTVSYPRYARRCMTTVPKRIGHQAFEPQRFYRIDDYQGPAYPELNRLSASGAGEPSPAVSLADMASRPAEHVHPNCSESELSLFLQEDIPWSDAVGTWSGGFG